MSYDEVCADHRWEVPAQYNIAADVCDKHPRDKPAMIWESFDGSTRELQWGELQDLANQAAHTLAACGVTRGDRVAVVLPPTPETAATFFGVWKLGAILLSMSVLYGDDGIEHRLSDSGARLLVTDPGNAPRFERSSAPETLVLEPDTLAAAATDFVCADTAADDPAQLYYTSGTTGLAKGIVHAHRYILGHEEFRYCHEVQDGERFHGMGEWAWAAGIAPLLGPVAARSAAVRLSARGRLRAGQAARLPEPALGDERIHHANGNALDDGGRGCGDPVSADVPARVLGGRAPESGGDPLVSRAVRRDRARLLRPNGVVPTRGELPISRGA